jgi:hypothetical protein
MNLTTSDEELLARCDEAIRLKFQGNPDPFHIKSLLGRIGELRYQLSNFARLKTADIGAGFTLDSVATSAQWVLEHDDEEAAKWEKK